MCRVHTYAMVQNVLACWVCTEHGVSLAYSAYDIDYLDLEMKHLLVRKEEHWIEWGKAPDCTRCEEMVEYAPPMGRTCNVGWVFLVARSKWWITGNCTLRAEENGTEPTGWTPSSLCANVSLNYTYREAYSVIPVPHGTLWVCGLYGCLSRNWTGQYT